MITTSTGQTVSCLTDNMDGTVTVRLHPNGTGARSALLREPSLREYAELRTVIVETHDKVNADFPPPAAPTGNLDPETPEGQVAITAYTEAVGEWTKQRNNAIKSLVDDDGKERVPPYAACMLAIVRRLAGQDLTLDDLVPEALQPRTYTGLLEVWDGPLGGAADDSTSNPTVPVLDEAATVEPPTAVPPDDDPPVPASPVPEGSSHPGTEHSLPSHPEPSTP